MNAINFFEEICPEFLKIPTQNGEDIT